MITAARQWAGLDVTDSQRLAGVLHDVREALLDESMAALCAGELTEIASVDNLFCGLFWACELVNDVNARTTGCEPQRR